MSRKDQKEQREALEESNGGRIREKLNRKDDKQY